jgi:hypothetical protein
MRHSGTLSVLLLTVVSTVAAQDKPDFSGQWKLIGATPSSAGAASGLTIRQPVTRTNVFGAPVKPAFLQLTIERAFDNRSTMETFQIGVDGGTVGSGSVRTSVSVRWEENRLAISTASYSGSGAGSERPTSEHKEVWEVDPDGMLIITVTDREAGRDPISNALTYRRN